MLKEVPAVARWWAIRGDRAAQGPVMSATTSDMDQIHLPDPVMEQLQALRQLVRADARIASIIERGACAHCGAPDADCPIRELKVSGEDD